MMTILGEGDITDSGNEDKPPSKMEEEESEEESGEEDEEKTKQDGAAMEEEGKVNLGIITAITHVTRCMNGIKEESPYQGQERDRRKETAEIAHYHQLQWASSACLLPLSRALKLGRRKSNDIETNQNLTNRLNEHNK